MQLFTVFFQIFVASDIDLVLIIAETVRNAAGDGLEKRLLVAVAAFPATLSATFEIGKRC